MTQLMLFDAPASVSVATPVAPAANEPAAAPADQPRRPSHQTAGQRGGMHHMGDLARLVLMRYEMVHRRRAALAERQARCAG